MEPHGRGWRERRERKGVGRCRNHNCCTTPKGRGGLKCIKVTPKTQLKIYSFLTASNLTTRRRELAEDETRIQ